MTATAQPPAPSNESPHPVLARAQGVELLGNVDGSGYKSGSALVRRADGQMVQLGPLMYALLEAIDGRSDTEQLAAELCRRLGRPCDEEHVVKLAEKLAEQGLLAGSEQNAPPRRNPLLALRFKVLITSPKATRRITAPFTFLFHPVVLWPAVAAFVAVLWFVLFRKGLGSATADAFDRPGLLLLVFALAVVSAAFHEIGHAAACRYGGATPGGMGAGLYMVWPAFYTDVTDAYRLPRRDRLRVDLGGIYFNALVAVATLGVWLALHVDALLLLVGLQVLMIVKNLSPVIRSDGYHILSDATGVPDLYAHLLPTLRRLIPGRPKEPSALRGRARLLVTVWVLVVVPVLLALMVGAVVLLPRMLATAWTSGHRIAAAMPHEGAVAIGASLLRLLALVLPVAGSILIAQRLARAGLAGARTWAGGGPVRQGALVLAASAAAAGAAFAWWPSGQYRAIRPSDHGTLVGFANAVSRPVAAVRPLRPVAAPPAVHLSRGTHLAVSLIPVGGATKARPALFVIPGQDGQPAVALVSTSTPDPAGAPSTEQTTTAPDQTATAATTTTPTQTADSPPTTTAAAFPFTLPSKPRPGDSQALAVNTKDGSVKYDIAYTLVTVSGGAPVTNANTAYAFASCRACTTVAVSFQVVLIVGTSRTISPINIAGALNKNCPACLTTAIADQIVVTLKSQPTPKLVSQIEAALKKLGAITALGANATPAAIAAQVGAVQQQIDTALQQSGQLANPATTSTTAPTTTQQVTTTAATTTTAAATTTLATTTTTAATTTTSAATTTTSATTTTTAPTTTEATTTATTTAETTTTTTAP